MVLSKVIVDVTISRRSFVFGQPRAKVCTGFTNVSTAPWVSSGLSLSLTLVSSRRKKVIGFCETRIL